MEPSRRSSFHLIFTSTCRLLARLHSYLVPFSVTHTIPLFPHLHLFLSQLTSTTHTLTRRRSPPSSCRPPQGSRLLFSQRATALLPPTPPSSSEVFFPFSHRGASLSSFILPSLSLSLSPRLSSGSLDRLQHSPAALSPGFLASATLNA